MPPHIILLMADHLRRDAIPCYGNLGPSTPHLDSISRESVVFDSAYCSTPLCIPTRNSIYSGKWPHTTGSIVNGGRYADEQPHALLPAHHRTIYEQLADHGYNINCFGLTGLHSTHSVQQRVPSAVFNPGPSPEDLLRQQGRDLLAVTKMMAPFRRPCPEYLNGRMVMKDFPTPRPLGPYPHPAESFPDLFYAANAERHIANLDFNQPQFLEVLFASPHPPLTCPEPWYSMYDPAKITLAPTVAQWCPGQPASLMRNFCGYLGTGLARDDWPPVWAVHFALTTLVDHCIGRIATALKARGVWDDCLVITQTDHGEMLGCHSLWEKHCCYEEAAHIPLLIKPPTTTTTPLHPPSPHPPTLKSEIRNQKLEISSHPPSAINHLPSPPSHPPSAIPHSSIPFTRRPHLTGHIDLAPTICDYANIPPLPGAQGQSLRPVIHNPDTPGRDIHFLEFNGNHGRGTPMRTAVAHRAGRTFKYIYNFDDIDELYDLANDPHEQRSLTAAWEYQPIRTELRRKLSDWMRDTGDHLEIPLTH